MYNPNKIHPINVDGEVVGCVRYIIQPGFSHQRGRAWIVVFLSRWERYNDDLYSASLQFALTNPTIRAMARHGTIYYVSNANHQPVVYGFDYATPATQ